jgi:hypothetical protein
MDFVQQLHAWIAGETAQGRIMVVAGILLSIAAVLILRSENVLLRGLLVPLALLVAMNLGYGYVLVSRPATSLKVEAAYRQSQTQTVERELNKARKDERYYKSARPVWALLTAVSVLLFFVFSGNYCRGLSMGLTAMFFGALLIDSFLHNRLLAYIDALQHLV